MLEGARQSLLQPAAVTGSEHSLEEPVDSTGRIAGAIPLDRGLHELAEERGLHLGGRNRPRGFHEDEGLHCLREVEGQLQRDHGARGVAHDVGALDAEMPHEETAMLGMVGDADRAPSIAAAASESGAVVVEQPIAVGKRGLP